MLGSPQSDNAQGIGTGKFEDTRLVVNNSQANLTIPELLILDAALKEKIDMAINPEVRYHLLCEQYDVLEQIFQLAQA